MQEPSLLLRLAMFHFPGGDGYLCGLLLFCLAHVGLIFNRQDRWRRPLTIASRIGLIWSFVLPSPTPRWLLVLFAASLLWLCLANWRSKSVSDPVVRSRHLQRVRRLSWLVPKAGPSPFQSRVGRVFDGPPFRPVFGGPSKTV